MGGQLPWLSPEILVEGFSHPGRVSPSFWRFRTGRYFWIEIGIGVNAPKWMDGFSDRKLLLYKTTTSYGMLNHPRNS
jgi:hypothetical protein